MGADPWTLVRDRVRQSLAGVETTARYGFVTRCSGEVITCTDLQVPIGTRCVVSGEAGEIGAEVVGFDDSAVMLMAERTAKGIRRGDRVRATHAATLAAVGDALLGRVLDAYGDPLDDLGPIGETRRWPLAGVPVNPMARARIAEPFDIGVRAINGITTLARGMRVGLFAGSGVGKSSLLGMATRHSEADRVVVAMIGERGREVREFIEDHIGEARKRTVVVVSAADSPPLARVAGAWRAAAIAEEFRSRGLQVLFLVDSLTRFAMAGREIGLAIGEPAASKGYPPSVFGQLAALVERAGAGAEGAGTITALYTVLVEADDHVGDPVADAARSVLDGHIVLSRRQSEAGIYPPIEVSMSLSRPMDSVVSQEHAAMARRFRLLWSRLQEKRELVYIGAYAPGRDPLFDDALARAGAMEAYVRQETARKVSLPEAVNALRVAVAEPTS